MIEEVTKFVITLPPNGGPKNTGTVVAGGMNCSRRQRERQDLLEQRRFLVGIIAADQPFEPVVVGRLQADFLGELLDIDIVRERRADRAGSGQCVQQVGEAAERFGQC